MKKLITLFAVKCFVIIYFTACTNVDQYAFSQSIAPIVTSGTWKVNGFVKSNNNMTGEFAGYEFTFMGDGTLTVNKNGVIENGTWSEDNVSKKVHFKIHTHNTTLGHLNEVWDVSGISNNEVRFDCNEASGTEHLNITNL